MKKYSIAILLSINTLCSINCQNIYEVEIPNYLHLNYQNLYFNNHTFCSVPVIDSALNSIYSLKLEMLKELPLINGSTETSLRFIYSSNIDKIGRITIIDTIAYILSYQTVSRTIFPNGGNIKVEKDSISVKASMIMTNLDELEKQLNFWNSENYIENEVDDCPSWIIEWSQKGRYHSLYRECPSDKFFESCEILLKLCKLDD
jgi:hypothetical protein